MEIHDLVSARIERFTPALSMTIGEPTRRPTRDGRGVTLTWTDGPVPVGDGKVDAADLTVYWDGDDKRFRATVQGVTIERDSGMTITCIANLVMNPRSTMVSDRFPRYSAAKLAVFTDLAVAWVRGGCVASLVLAAI